MSVLRYIFTSIYMSKYLQLRLGTAPSTRIFWSGLILAHRIDIFAAFVGQDELVGIGAVVEDFKTSPLPWKVRLENQLSEQTILNCTEYSSIELRSRCIIHHLDQRKHEQFPVIKVASINRQPFCCYMNQHHLHRGWTHIRISM